MRRPHLCVGRSKFVRTLGGFLGVVLVSAFNASASTLSFDDFRSSFNGKARLGILVVGFITFRDPSTGIAPLIDAAAPAAMGAPMVIAGQNYAAAADEADAADPWTDWMQVPDGQDRGKKITKKIPFPECPAGTTPTPDWTKPDNGEVRQTPALPLHSGPSLCEEGPFYVTKNTFASFILTI